METPSPIAITNSDHLLKSFSSNSFHLRSPSLNYVRLRRVFDLFNSNHDSLITVDEIARTLTLLGLDTDASDLYSIIKSYVHPGNAGLAYDNFVTLHRSINDLFFGVEEARCKDEQDEVDLVEAFKVFDENDDGFISATELQKVLEKLGFTEVNEMGRVKMMISSVDLNHDGRVDFSEFKDMMQALGFSDGDLGKKMKDGRKVII